MRIISKQRDYYDSVMKHVTDDPNVFVRNKSEVKLEPLEFSESILNKMKQFWRHTPIQDSPFSLRTIMIGFCGKVYPALQVTYDPSTKYQWKENETYNFYDIEHYRKFIDETVKDQKFSKRYYKGREGRYSWSRNCDADEFISEFLNKWSGSEDFSDLFFQFKSPIFVLRQENKTFRVSWGGSSYSGVSRFDINTPLQKYNFQKMFDPYMAFQELEMYYFGVLGCTEKDTVQISDLDMRNQKGFDDMSFKKYPTKKRK